MLKVSCKQCTVNPDYPVWQAGGATRTKKALGIYNDIKVMAMAIEINESGMLMISVDATALTNEDVAGLKKQIQQRTKIREAAIFIVATHTHSAPALRSNTINSDQVDLNYKQFVFEKIIEISALAVASVEEAEAFVQQGEVWGYYGNRDDKNKAGDQTVTSIQFRNAAGNNVAVLLNLHCHPTFLDQNLLMISSDLAGVLRENLAGAYGVEPMFVCGVTGDMSSRYYRQGQDYFELERAGKGISKAILDFDKAEPLKLNEMNIQEVNYLIHREIDLGEIESKLNMYLEQKETETDPIELRLLATKIRGARNTLLENQKQIHIELKSAIITLGDLQIVTFNNDPVVKFGKQIKQASKRKCCITMNHVNGEVGYLVEKEDFNTGYIGNVTKALPGQAEEYIQKIIELM